MLYQQSLPWMVGAKYSAISRKWSDFHLDYDKLKQCPPPNKTKLISIICSDKKTTPDHRQRIIFTDRLKEYFGNRIDVYGKEGHLLEDKWSALYDYKYHIAIENSSINDYWTEKLSDSFLGLCFPIYYGCKNINQYFDIRSFQAIDIYNIDESINKIDKILDQNLYEDSLSWLIDAKNKVLDTYNLFPYIISMVSMCNSINKKEVIVRPQGNCSTILDKLLGLFDGI
jgi:hypothetical protein